MEITSFPEARGCNSLSPATDKSSEQLLDGGRVRDEGDNRITKDRDPGSRSAQRGMGLGNRDS